MCMCVWVGGWLGGWVGVPLKALFLVSRKKVLFQTPRSIFIFKCTNLKMAYSITLIVLVIGKAQFRRAMLSCDSSCCTWDKENMHEYLYWVNFPSNLTTL